MKQALVHVESDHVVRTHQRQWTTGCGFGRDVQNDRPVSCTAHAGVGNTDHVGYSLAKELGGKHHVAHFSHSRIAPWATILKNHDAALIDVQPLVIDLRVEFLNRFEYHRPAAM